MKKLVPISIIYTISIVYALGYLSIEFFGNYGWTLFLLAPLLLGFLPSFVISNVKPVSKTKSFILGFSSLFLASFGLLVLGAEGIICVLMSLPLFIIATFLGVLLVQRINIQKINNPIIILAIILAYILSFFSLDYVNYTDDIIPVTSSIVVDAPINSVWDTAIKSAEISEPDALLDKFGIGYPKNITYFGEGVGATRDLNFSTGSYLQTVETWNPPHLIVFVTEKTPAPITESNPFWDEVHPLHLKGYFVSVKSEIKLTKLSATKTKAESTTWYKVHITPILYWKFWSNAVVKRFHKAYLTTLKLNSEK